ncbi:putative glutamate--cysteine ligase 2-2 [Tersicoccus solisilvae]|uniref:Putative glutamate--cysteine ligase 2 n=1 Tax=Tersicoccus solisilvae TaxID=1882339 RepID=A0ABQ1PP37_9MICC|nr:YbdK family carboxylate-amine ligase [Tersicoccus solisilvae]GGD00271.1 putative glutamate--cysteine ligase 2-2 [Tersicoccus solisilvae]
MADDAATVTPRTLGVEEEFHLVDLDTRTLASRAPDLLPLLPDDGYVAELQRCCVETNSAVATDLEALRADLVRRRAVLAGTAAGLGLGVAAAGAMPLAATLPLEPSEGPRYQRMFTDYAVLAREQLVCGSQVHVGVADRDDAVRVAPRLAAWLPTLLALSASSPFSADGTDTGYASTRTLLWQRWPTTGTALRARDAADYDAQVAALVATGVIADAGMVYTDVRPATVAPTLELRLCDSCPDLDTLILIAGLYRALVERELAGLRADPDRAPVPETLARAARWRAARSGLEGDLIDVPTATPRPAATVVRDLTEALAPWLEATGDLAQVHALQERVLAAGSSAAQQRRALARRGRAADVVDLLVGQTAAG